MQTSSIFDVQDDIAARIVATVADSYGVLVHSMREASRQKDDGQLTPAEWQFQYLAYRERITPTAHEALRSRLESAAGSDNRPSNFMGLTAYFTKYAEAQIDVDKYAFGFPGDDGTSPDRALVAARRGVELDRANQFAMVALAQTHFFRQDLAAFGPAAERAMALKRLLKYWSGPRCRRLWGWPRRERSVDIRSDLVPTSNAGQHQNRRNPGARGRRGGWPRRSLVAAQPRGCA